VGVADLRAATPTAAAQVVIPTRGELEDRLHGLEVRLSRSVETSLARGRSRLYALRERITSPERMIMNRRQRIDELEASMTARVRRKASDGRRRLERLSVSLSSMHPGRRLAEQRGALSRQTERLTGLMQQRVRALGERFSVACSRLDALSPLGVLSRGYAIATRKRDAAVIKSPDDVDDGEALDLRLERGLLPCTAKKD
jgi:exodeoxyribonuclease VII large subunit